MGAKQKRAREMVTLEEAAPLDPLMVEVTRGEMMESRHRVSAVVVDAEGRVAFRAGDPAAAVYPRSAIKPVQALAVIESGAAEAHACSDQEIALACASHAGEAAHVEAVAGWLERIGCAEGDLECGSHLPYDWGASVALLRAARQPGQLHNNCSGKHSGFLTLARHQSWQTQGYIDYAHPVQQRLLGLLESMCGLDLSTAPWGVDGCGIPTIAIPLANIALAMARLGVPDDQPERRQAACHRVRQAMTAHPRLVSGTGRFCTRVIDTTEGRALVKTGAEGVYAACFPELGLGAALKAEDGAGRASEAAMAYLLARFEILSEAETAALADLLDTPVVNRVGRTVGRIRATDASG